MNITLTGNLGSGKGSVSDIFKEWGYGYVSGGEIFRGVAREKGISVAEMNELAKKDRTIDDLIDARSVRLGDELDHTLFDTRLAWHFVRESFKVFLLVDTDEAARRVFNGKNREMEVYTDQEDCARGLGMRAQMERERFQTLYNIDYYDMNNYNLVIESTNATAEQIAEEIRRSFEEYQKERFDTRIELNLRAMYPQTDLTEEELDVIRACGSAEVEEEQSLVADMPVRLISCGGYNYIDGDAVELMKAAAAGKVFGRIEAFRKDAIEPAVSAETLQGIQEAVGFAYRSLPTEKPVKNDYMMDLTK